MPTHSSPSAEITLKVNNEGCHSHRNLAFPHEKGSEVGESAVPAASRSWTIASFTRENSCLTSRPLPPMNRPLLAFAPDARSISRNFPALAKLKFFPASAI